MRGVAQGPVGLRCSSSSLWRSPGFVTVHHMLWVMVVALVVVLCVAAAVLPRRSGEEREGFPWFWVVFPLTCLAAGITISGSLPGSLPMPGSGPTRYMHGHGATVDYFTVLNWLNAFLAAGVVVGTILSFWARRKRRV